MNQKANKTDLPIYDVSGEHIGYLDIFPETDLSKIQDIDNENKLIIFYYSK